MSTCSTEFSEVYLSDVRLPADARLGPVDSALASYRERRAGDRVLRERVSRMWTESEVVRMVALRAAQLGQTGDPGPVGSVGKLLGAEHAQRIHELLVDLLGAEGMLFPERNPDGWPTARSPHVAFLRSRAYTIEGGTSEVMRNILAERILGLPRDDHGPKDRPWREIPRS